MALRILRGNEPMMPAAPEPDPIANRATARKQLGEIGAERTRLRELVLALERRLHQDAEKHNAQRADELVEAVLAGTPIPALASLAAELAAARERLAAVETARSHFKSRTFEPADRAARRFASKQRKAEHRELIRKQAVLLESLADLVAAETTLRSDLARQGLLDDAVLPACSFPNIGSRREPYSPVAQWFRWLAQTGLTFDED